MPRIIHEQPPLRVFKKLRPWRNKVYPDTHRGLRDYLADKYGLGERDAGYLIQDLFRFIEQAVLRGERGWLSIEHFGRFTRRAINHGLEDGSTQVDTVLRFTQKDTGYSMVDIEDDEWVDE